MSCAFVERDLKIIPVNYTVKCTIMKKKPTRNLLQRQLKRPKTWYILKRPKNRAPLGILLGTSRYFHERGQKSGYFHERGQKSGYFHERTKVWILP